MSGINGPKTNAVNQQFIKRAQDTAKEIFQSKDFSPAQKEAAFRGLGNEIFDNKFIPADVKKNAILGMAQALPAERRDDVMNTLLSNQQAKGHLTEDGAGVAERGKVTVQSSHGGDQDSLNAQFMQGIYGRIIR